MLKLLAEVSASHGALSTIVHHHYCQECFDFHGLLWTVYGDEICALFNLMFALRLVGYYIPVKSTNYVV